MSYIVIGGAVYLTVMLVVVTRLIASLPPEHPSHCDENCRRCAAAIDLGILWPVTIVAFALRRLVWASRRRRGQEGGE